MQPNRFDHSLAAFAEGNRPTHRAEPDQGLHREVHPADQNLEQRRDASDSSGERRSIHLGEPLVRAESNGRRVDGLANADVTSTYSPVSRPTHHTSPLRFADEVHELTMLHEQKTDELASVIATLRDLTKEQANRLSVISRLEQSQRATADLLEESLQRQERVLLKLHQSEKQNMDLSAKLSNIIRNSQAMPSHEPFDQSFMPSPGAPFVASPTNPYSSTLVQPDFDTLEFPANEKARYPKLEEYPKLDDQKDHNEFIEKLSMFVRTHKIPSAELTKKLINCFSGNREVWFRSILPQYDGMTLHILCVELRDRFSTPEYLRRIRAKLDKARFPSPFMPDPTTWMNQVVAWIRLLEPTISFDDLRAKLLMKIPPTMQLSVEQKEQSSILGMVEVPAANGKTVLKDHNGMCRSRLTMLIKAFERVASVTQLPADKPSPRPSFPANNQTDRRPERTDRPRPLNTQSRDVTDLTCYSCGGKGHISTSPDCPRNRNNGQPPARKAPEAKVHALDNEEGYDSVDSDDQAWDDAMAEPVDSDDEPGLHALSA